MTQELSDSELSSCRSCDECGKVVQKIWRVRFGHRYCSTCYARVFKRAQCKSCGNFARIPRNIPDALCIECERAGPCNRCGKTDYAIGKLTTYGSVCASCARYYGQVHSCEYCGTHSSHCVSVKYENANIYLCPGCAPTEHQTCQSCHRYRKLNHTHDGRWLCKLCADVGLIDCPLCHKQMPAGYGKRCEDCYWEQLLDKRVTLSREAFSSSEIRNHFDVFGHWLGAEVGAHKAAITINKYVDFFAALDKHWQSVPDYSSLLEHFGAEGLRRVRLPMRWLSNAGHVKVDTKARELDSEQRRIQTTLAKLPSDSVQGKLLDSYYQLLLKRHENNRLSIRSLRFSLTPAVTLLMTAIDEDTGTPKQEQLNALLLQSPGQRASISGFVAYLRDHHQLPLSLPPVDPKRARKNRLKKLENEMAKLVESPIDETKAINKWVELALNYFHDIPRKTGRTLARSGEIIKSNDGYWVHHDSKQFYIPARPVHTYQ